MHKFVGKTANMGQNYAAAVADRSTLLDRHASLTKDLKLVFRQIELCETQMSLLNERIQDIMNELVQVRLGLTMAAGLNETPAAAPPPSASGKIEPRASRRVSSAERADYGEDTTGKKILEVLRASKDALTSRQITNLIDEQDININKVAALFGKSRTSMQISGQGEKGKPAEDSAVDYVVFTNARLARALDRMRLVLDNFETFM